MYKEIEKDVEKNIIETFTKILEQSTALDSEKRVRRKEKFYFLLRL